MTLRERKKRKERKKNNPQNSGHFVSQQRLKAAHALCLDQNRQKVHKSMLWQYLVHVMGQLGCVGGLDHGNLTACKKRADELQYVSRNLQFFSKLNYSDELNKSKLDQKKSHIVI